MTNCKICNSEFKSFQQLSKHILHKHSLKSREYYDKFKEPSEGNCVECGAETNFIGISGGYRETCGNSCSGILKRRRLRNDNEKFEKFTSKVSSNQSDIWNKRNRSGDRSIHNKISNTCKEISRSMSPEERSIRYGWLNKLSPEEKRIAVDDILRKSLKKWHSTVSNEELQLMYERRACTLRKTWEERGDEIMNKQIETFIKNSTISELEMDKMCSSVEPTAEFWKSIGIEDE
jgi:hypothetical protein